MREQFYEIRTSL